MRNSIGRTFDKYKHGLTESRKKNSKYQLSFIHTALALAKRSDGHSLRVASEIMSKEGENEQARVLAFQAMQSFEKNDDANGLAELFKNTHIDEIKQQKNEEKTSTFAKETELV